MAEPFTGLGSLVSRYCSLVTRMTHHTHIGTVSFAAARDLADTCRQLGVMSTAQLAAMKLDEPDASNAQARLPETTLISLWQAIAASHAEPGIGLKIGQMINPAAKGLLASWISQCATLGEALAIFRKNIALMNPSEHWHVSHKTNSCSLRLSLCEDRGYPDMAIERSMSAMVIWARALSRHPFPVERACFRFARPSYHALFIPIFGPHLEFEARESRLCFDARLLDLPLVSSNPLLKGIVANQAQKALKELKLETPIVHTVKTRLREAISSGQALPITHLCRGLNMSRQTLYRQLKQQNTDFQSLNEQVRKERALELIEAGLDTTAISLSLGYKEPGSFYKAFKRWFGTTPKAYAMRARDGEKNSSEENSR